MKDQKRAECIVFASTKGGTGKTTSCLSIAGCLAKRGSEVLVVDFDPQANATSGLGIDKMKLHYSIYDAVLSRCGGYRGVPITQAILSTRVEKLHIAPSEINLGVGEVMMHRAKNRTGILDSILDEARPYYNYILIDLPPSAGILTINGLRAADIMVVPVQPGAFANNAVESLRTILLEIEHNTGHFVSHIIVALCRYVKPDLISRVMRRQNPSQEIEARMREMFPALHIIPESDKIYEAQKKRLPISHYAPDSEVGRAYEALAMSIVGGH